MKKIRIVLALAILLCAVTEAAGERLAGSGKTVPETPSQKAQIASLPYQPGCETLPSAHIAAGPEVLESITYEETDAELTRYRVSNRQHDLVKHGRRVGGFLLIDIPRGMLEKAADSFDGFKVLAQYVGSKVLCSEKAVIHGGGHTAQGSHNSFVSVSFRIGNGLGKAQQLHHIYVGEKYCYDFWYDQTWFYDGGRAIMESFSAEDIKPERNREAVFNWTAEEVKAQGKYIF